MTKLIDADALFEAIGKNSNIAYHKNIVNQCDVYIKKYQSMTGFGYEVDQANKRLRLHKQYIDEVLDLITNAPTVQREVPLQVRIKPWMDACFGEAIANDKLERGDRFLEESLELLQSGDYPKERIYALVEYTYGRPKGEPAQEVGGVMITLGAYCLAHKLDMHEAGETELARIWTKVEQIREKQRNKPTGSALPIATTVQHEGWVSVPIEPTKEMLEAAPKE